MKRLLVPSAAALAAFTLLNVLFAHAAAAQSVLGACPDANGINVLPQKFCNATSSWFGNALALGQHFFLLLVGIELAWSAILWVFQKEHLGELLAAFILKMMGVWFFYGILLSGATNGWITGLIGGFVGLGGAVTGQPANLDPMNLLNIGINICNAVFVNLPTAHFGFSLLDINGSVQNDLIVAFCMLVAVIFASILCLIVFLSFLIAAGQLIMTLIEVYIMIGAGAVFLGFTGSRWTMPYGEKWIGYAIALGIKLFVTYIIIALGLQLFPSGVQNATACAGGADPGGLCSYLFQIHQLQFGDVNSILQLGTMVVDFLIVGASAVIFMMLTMRLPGLAAAMMNGSPNLTLAGAVSTAQTVGGAVAGTVGAIAGTVQTVVKEGGLAVMDAAMLAGGAAGAGGGEAAGAGDAGAAGQSAGGGSSLPSLDSIPVAGHALRAATAPISGTLAAVGAAASPLTHIDEGGGGGSVSVNLRLPE